MRAVIELLVVIIFSIVVGTNSVKMIYILVKKEAIQKVDGGFNPLQNFTRKMTER